MDTKQIESALVKLFDEDGHRIVFWNDPEQEFLSFMNGLPMFFLDGVKVLRLDRMGVLEAKIRIERDDPSGKYLVYARVPLLLGRCGLMCVPLFEPHAKMPPSFSLANGRRVLSGGMRFKQCSRGCA